MALEVKFEIVRSAVHSWQSLFEQAANVATKIGREKVISISHSADDGDGIVTIWYWTENETNVLGLEESGK